MFKFGVICGITVPVFLAGFLILFARAQRGVAMADGRVVLGYDYGHPANIWYSTNAWSAYHVWLSSNTVTIGGTEYHCFLEMRSQLLGRHGTLAITSNRTFIWLGDNAPPKIIPLDYKPPLFGY